ncbi:SLC13 family permease [Rhodobacter sp. NSM]|uniref:SLC13 family permease n=1 Tax=Rhodobacter sp. NSM TaxID=3457501 RepID=UPI003FD5BFA2
MTVELVLVLALLFSAIVMFALNRPRMDAVAVIMMVALPFTGALTLRESLSGFADPNVILIGALFVIGEALVRTGITKRLGDWVIARAAGSETRLVIYLMAAVAALSAIMSSTGVVAIFIPVVLRIARDAHIPVGRLMMPLSVAALTSGMTTLVATPPNLVLHGELVRTGHEGFSFFAFTPFGLPMLVVAVLWMLVARRFLGGPASLAAPEPRHLGDWVAEYGLAGHEARLRIGAASPLAGAAVSDADFLSSRGMTILAIERPGIFGAELIHPKAATRLRAGDILLLDLERAAIDLPAMRERWHLEDLPPSGAYFADRVSDIGMAEVMIPATSSFVGRTLLDLRFRSVHDLAVVAMKHGAQSVAGPVADEKLREGDTLLVVGPWRAIRRIGAERREMILLDLPGEAEDVAPEGHRAPAALAVLVLVVALMVSGIVPNVQAALVGCLLLGLLRCIDMRSALASIRWETLVLIVGMLPFSIALQRTGGVDLAAEALIGLLGDAGPRAILGALFCVTTALGLFISNTATAVLMAPVAVALAERMGASPHPFAMIVALGASSAFMTPVASPVNMLVVGPGGYRFMDFVKVGVPLTIASLLVGVVMVPILLPL